MWSNPITWALLPVTLTENWLWNINAQVVSFLIKGSRAQEISHLQLPLSPTHYHSTNTLNNGSFPSYRCSRHHPPRWHRVCHLGRPWGH
ncbi:hypothetical protein FIBSPDRAFT_857564 [Athelia psychrophila]|uniref:Secreted protein n=1 Tax=Athelia psychrophila TaxID=1759441 RepID=A0A166MLB8_9AGAM|nr:hypothetical protein FIBSPDRAFT_857564 [Fibularhizoctonia sp. CBS 109695]